jgi:hypothetical protein
VSWSLFKTKCAVLTGKQHISETQFAQVIADAYHQCISLHFDTMTAGGKLVNNAPKLPLLQQQIQVWCTANLGSHQDVDFLKQIGPAFIQYWTGIIIVGPTGTVSVLNPGIWNNIKVVQNFDFQIILNALILSCRTHIMSLQGQYVSSVVPGVTAPWSGALLQSLP